MSLQLVEWTTNWPLVLPYFDGSVASWPTWHWARNETWALDIGNHGVYSSIRMGRGALVL